MLTRISKLRYFCSSSTPSSTASTSTMAITNNLAFKSLKDPTINDTILKQLGNSHPQTKAKLDALTDVILSLSKIQLQYLVCLQNQAALASAGNRITDSLILSTDNSRRTTVEYLYQKRWMNQVWKDYHILTSLFSDEGDKQGVQEVVQTVKEVYEFELTTVDPAQKIKVIKVIRELLNLGLKQAKDIVDKVPVVMKKGKKQQGEKLKEQLAKSGCVVTLK